MSKCNEKKRCNSNSCQSEQSQYKKSKTEIDYQPNNCLFKYIPMKNRSTNVNKTFKTPLCKAIDQNKSTNSNKLSTQQQIEEVNHDIKNLIKQGYNIEQLDLIIEKLHLYNNIKDQAQNVLEKIAHVKGVTIKKIHELYGLDPKDD